MKDMRKLVFGGLDPVRLKLIIPQHLCQGVYSFHLSVHIIFVRQSFCHVHGIYVKVLH